MHDVTLNLGAVKILIMGLSFSTYPKKKGKRVIEITTRVPLLQYAKVMRRSKRTKH